MALNYDPILNRLRTFRFAHGNDLESLLQERLEDSLDIEEYGKIQRKKKRNQYNFFVAFAGIQVLHYFTASTSYFKKSHPYLRVFTSSFFIFGPMFYHNLVMKRAEHDLLVKILLAKVSDKYEDPITPKYSDLYEA